MTTKTKPHLDFWQIWNMCFGFFGIQIGWGLQNANVSRIFQSLGAAIDEIPILWIAAPLTGLLVQPIVGYFSDHTWNRLGRRRPYFLGGAILASLALFVMPNSSFLWMAAVMLWIMDASINITMEPFRAFVGDMLPDEQRTRGFAMQSFFIGTGAVIASAMPWMMTNWLGISNIAEPGAIPDSVRYSFYIGGSAYFISVIWTVFSTREYPPEDLEAFDKARTESLHIDTTIADDRSPAQFFKSGGAWLAGGILLTAVITSLDLAKELYVLGFGFTVFGLLQFAAAWFKQRRMSEHGFLEVMEDLFAMPRAMKQLAVVQFFSWFALFAMWIYSTAAVTAYHYGTTDTSTALYNQGADWVGILFASLNGFAALTAFAIPVVARRVGKKVAHMINLWLGGLGLIAFFFIRDPALLWIPMIGMGVAWASILSMPYAILSGSLPASRMGVFMGIFNFFITIPQLVAASILGLLVKFVFDGQAIFALVLGGISLLIAGLTTLLVDDPTEKKQTS
ncbi:MAG TPA: MFS transporter [Xanthomonadales bacterium]